VLVEGVRSATVAGTPPGGVISPLLANVYLHAFDRSWAESGTGELVRYADDFVVLCTTRSQAEAAQARAAALPGGLGLALHPDKTRVVDLREGKEGFASSVAIFTPACRAACGSSKASSATTCTGGRRRGR
jgi:RNA-directed DNA polymerase